jgi:hypothetical protein
VWGQKKPLGVGERKLSARRPLMIFRSVDAEFNSDSSTIIFRASTDRIPNPEKKNFCGFSKKNQFLMGFMSFLTDNPIRK